MRVTLFTQPSQSMPSTCSSTVSMRSMIQRQCWRFSDKTAPMSIATRRTPWSALLVCFALVMLAPRVSLAHAGHGDERLAFDGGGPGAVFSLSCPANPDHGCGCGNLAGLLRVGEPLAA